MNSDVSSQNHCGQVGGGENSLGVPKGRELLPIGSIQNIGQSATGISQQSGQRDVQQSPPQSPMPGVQEQQPSEPSLTTTPPVQTPSPQGMGKSVHPQAQSLQQSVHVINQKRSPPQVCYQPGARQQALRGVNQRGDGAQVVGMEGADGGGGQQTAMYPHPGTVYVQDRVPLLIRSHTGPHQQSAYIFNNNMQSLQRHQVQHNQPYYPSYQPTIVAPNIFGRTPAPMIQHAGFYYPPPGSQINLSRAAAGAVTGGAQRVESPLPGGQGATVLQQGGNQQPSQQPQPLPSITVPLGQAGLNGGGQNLGHGSLRRGKQGRKKAILDILDPKTGNNISEEIYDDDAATHSDDLSYNTQKCGMQMVFDFAARVPKAAMEESDSGSPASSSAPDMDMTTYFDLLVAEAAKEKFESGSSAISHQKQPLNEKEQLCENEEPNEKNILPRRPLFLKHTYKDNQWSPINRKGEKVYDHDFLMKLRSHPNSNIEPLNLPDSIKGHSRIDTWLNRFCSDAKNNVLLYLQNRAAVDTRRFNDVGLSKRYSVLYPPSNLKRDSQRVKPKNNKPTVIEALFSGRRNFEMKETDTQIHQSTETNDSQSDVSNEDSATVDLTVKLREVLNQPTPQKIDELAKDFAALNLSSQAQLRSVVELIFDTAVDEPVSLETCALMCKEFAWIRVTVPEGEAGKEDSIVDFGNLIITRCIMEFEDAVDKIDRAILKRDILLDSVVFACRLVSPYLDSFDYWEKLTEEERRFHTKSFRNIRFMGELFKQGMLTSFTMHRCIRHLLIQPVDESIESLCELLGSIGKYLESKDQNLEPYFKQMLDIVNLKVTSSVSQRVRTMLENVIESKKNKWIVPTVDTAMTDLIGANQKHPFQIVNENDKEVQHSVPGVHDDNENIDQNDQTKGRSLLKDTNFTEQYIPPNTSKRRVYDREFLIKLQSNPNSKIKPTNLPDMEVLLKDNSRNRGAVDMKQFKDFGLSKHDSLFPGFAKSQSARGPVASKQSSQQDKPNSKKPSVIHVSSLREDVELRETKDPWERDRMKPTDADEEEIKTEALYKKVRGVLNKLTPQKFDTLVNQVRALQIDSQDRLQGVVDLVFEKVIDEPNSSIACALMCKELAMMQVRDSNTRTGKEESNINFRKLIITRCQMEFEKNTVDENARAIKKNEIDACLDRDKKKELLHVLNEEEKKIRVKSVRNIRFIGELFKQGMLMTNIMHRCIRHLLTQTDEESLECLCMLLIRIGKDLESKGQSLEPYIKQMLDIVNRKGTGKVSSRVCFKLQYVIQLRLNKWIPSIAECNPKTVNKTKKKVGTESLDMNLNNTSMNDSGEDRRNNGCDGGPIGECGLSPLPSIEKSELKNKAPPMGNLQLGNKNVLQELITVPVGAPKIVARNELPELKNKSNKQVKSALPLAGSSDVQLALKTATILEEYLSDARDMSITNAALKVRETFNDTTLVNFVREMLNGVVKKSVTARKQVSQLMTHLLSKNILPLPLYLAGLGGVLDHAEGLEIYTPEIWVYLAELIWYPLAEGIHPFSELKTTMAHLKNKGLAGKLIVELTTMLVQEKTLKWIENKWDESGLQWSDFFSESESKDFIKKFESDFLVVVSRSGGSSSRLKNQLSMEEIQERLILLMSSEKEYSLFNITNWISVNVGERIIKSEFVKLLMTAILKVSIEPYNGTWQFRVDKFRHLQALIPRYIDVSIKLLELQFLISIQEYIHQLEHPQRIHLQMIEKQTIESIVSFDVFDALENNDGRKPLNRKSLAILAVKAFFTSLKPKII